MKTSSLTLTQTLKRLGYKHRPAEHADATGKHEITRGKRVVFTGTAHETWGWLRRSKEIA